MKAALSRQWEESRTQCISLPEIEIQPFEGYSHWLYTDTILITNDPLAMHELVELYILGDYLDDSAFRRAVLEHMVLKRFELGWMPRGNSVELAWAQTAPSSPVRKVITELMLSRPMSFVASWFKEDECYPRDFTVDVFWHFAQSQDQLLQGRSRETTKKNCRRYIEEAAPSEAERSS